jgi:hypothetical protein
MGTYTFKIFIRKFPTYEMLLEFVTLIIIIDFQREVDSCKSLRESVHSCKKGTQLLNLRSKVYMEPKNRIKNLFLKV